MGKANPKNINDFSKIAEFLRCLTYGCYHKTQLSDKKLIEDKELLNGAGISERTYENYLKRISFFLPDENTLATLEQGRRTIYRFVANRNAKNELAGAYLRHSISKHDAFGYLLILQALAAAATPLKLSDIIDAIASAITSVDGEWEADDNELPERTYQRKIADLVDWGIVTAKPGKRYALTPSPFAGLTDAERAELTLAICAHRELALLSVPGYQLIRHEPDGIPLQLVNHSSARIIEDYNVYKLARAITEQRAISFSIEPVTIKSNKHNEDAAATKDQSDKKQKLCLPHKICIDTIRGRNYLVATDLRHNSGTVTYRLERINNLTLLDDKSMEEINGTIAATLAKPARTRTAAPLVLQARVMTSTEHDSLAAELLDRFPRAQLRDVEPDILEAEIVIEDKQTLIPYLRTLTPPVRIVSPEHQSKQDRLEKDVKEALRNYGQR